MSGSAFINQHKSLITICIISKEDKITIPHESHEMANKKGNIQMSDRETNDKT